MTLAGPLSYTIPSTVHCPTWRVYLLPSTLEGFYSVTPHSLDHTAPFLSSVLPLELEQHPGVMAA